MNWKVVFTSQASRFEKPFTKTVAMFDSLVNAQDFIDLVIPEETRSMFRVEHIESEVR